jgi:hypothetical protein
LRFTVSQVFCGDSLKLPPEFPHRNDVAGETGCRLSLNSSTVAGWAKIELPEKNKDNPWQMIGVPVKFTLLQSLNQPISSHISENI